MSILVVRHGLSEANDKSSAAFGMGYAPLLPLGVDQARLTGVDLAWNYNVDFENTPVAASEMLRSQETARVAGFTGIKNYALLNEVDVPKTPELRAMLDQEIIVPEAYEAVEKLLANRPTEAIWFTHGYLIAALCDVAGFDRKDLRFIPKFGEVRELDI